VPDSPRLVNAAQRQHRFSRRIYRYDVLQVASRRPRTPPFSRLPCRRKRLEESTRACPSNATSLKRPLSRNSLVRVHNLGSSFLLPTHTPLPPATDAATHGPVSPSPLPRVKPAVQLAKPRSSICSGSLSLNT